MIVEKMKIKSVVREKKKGMQINALYIVLAALYYVNKTIPLENSASFTKHRRQSKI